MNRHERNSPLGLVLLVVAAVMLLFLVVFMIHLAQANNSYSLLGKPVFGGIYQGWNKMIIANIDTERATSELTVIRPMDKDETYLILIYKVPKDWPSNIEIDICSDPIRDRLYPKSESIGVC